MGGIRCTARYLLIIEKDAIFQALTQDKLFEQLPCVLVTAKGMPDVATRAFCSHIMSEFPSMTVSLKKSADSFGLDNHFVNNAADDDPSPLMLLNERAKIVAQSYRSNNNLNRCIVVAMMLLIPNTQVLGLVDWNPAGVRILHTYKYGSTAGGLEGSRFTLPTLSWLGLRSCMLLPPGGGSADEDLSVIGGMQPLTRRDRALAGGLIAALGPLGEEGWCAEVRDMKPWDRLSAKHIKAGKVVSSQSFHSVPGS